MSHFSVQGEQSTSSEITALQNLTALATSGAGEFLRKTGATTFENATPSGGGGGTVSGPVSSTDTALVRWNGTAGDTLQDSAVLLSSTVLFPGTSDGVALGSTTKMWSDLFLASGAVINFNNGDVTLTHSADTLTLGGGNLALGANSLTMTGSLAATGARVTKGWFTDVESTNMPTVGGTAILTSLTAPQFTTIELGHASDTTLSRSSAGILAVEGVTVSLNSTSAVHTASTIELGAASDTTLARVSAGVISVEGSTVAMLPTAQTFTALQTYSLAGVVNRLVNTTDGASVQIAKFEGDRATMAANDEAYLSFHLSDSAGNQDEFARIAWKATTVTSTSEVGRLNISLMSAGSLVDTVQLTTSVLSPTTNDLVALGSTSLMWSDVFLASGAVINFNNGDVTLTHSADTLTLGGGNLALGSNSLTITGSIAATGSRVTKIWTADLESTNMPTVGGTAILTSLTAPQFTTIELGHASDTTIARVSAGVISVEGATVAMLSTAQTFTALQTYQLAGVVNRMVNTTDGESVQVAKFEGDRATMAANDEAYNSYLLSDSAGNQDEFARFTWKGTTITNASEVARLNWSLYSAGTLTNTLQLTPSVLSPTTSDGVALGSGSLMWSDIFLASGAVLNFNNGDVTLTHGSNLITFAGGQWTFGSNTAYFTETDNGNSSTADTIDWTLGNKQKSTLTGNCTFTFTAPGGPCSLILKLVQDGTGSRTVTWPAAVHWSGGTAPTLTTTASKVDIISFYYDGSTYFGTSSLNYTS